MLELFLFILKVMGVFILILLLLLLILLGLLLFAPIRYKSSGYKDENAFRVEAYLSYLYPVLQVKFFYNSKLAVKVKFLWITIYEYPQKEINVDVPVPKTEPVKKEKNAKPVKEEPCTEKIKEAYTERIKQPEAVKSIKKIETVKSDKEIVGEKEESKKLDVVSYYVNLYQDNKELIIDVLKTILCTLKTILPRKCNIDITFGTGKADITGYIYGIYCSMQQYLPGQVVLRPVWVEKYLQGEYSLSGHIRIFPFLAASIKIVANKNVRLLYKKIRRV